MSEMRQNNHGTYETVTQEKELMKITTSIKHVVVAFFHKDFRRCLIVDKHLEVVYSRGTGSRRPESSSRTLQALAKKHFRTKFVKIDVDNAPFLVDRLKVQVLPCILSFVDGVSSDR